LSDNAPGQSAPDTVVLVHGFWVTQLSWEKWVKRYEAKGYRVLTPTCPGFEGGVEALREDPSPIEALTFPAVVEHIGGIIDGLEKPLDHHRSLGGRRAHPDPPRPRLRRRRC
jgi:pimeloyl-ACP methyl ester carboxylesterase